MTGPGRVSAAGNRRSRVRFQAATYQSLEMVLAATRLALKLKDWSTQCQDNVVSCQVFGAYDTSVRQHYKSEHWAPCYNQTQSWYVESDVKSGQTKQTFHYSLCMKKYLLKTELSINSENYDAMQVTLSSRLFKNNKIHLSVFIFKADFTTMEDRMMYFQDL